MKIRKNFALWQVVWALVALCALNLELQPALAQANNKPLAARPETNAAPVWDSKKWESEVFEYEKQDVLHPPPKHPILFVGSSSIRRWTNLSACFPKHNVIGRGLGGSHIIDSVFFADRIVFPYAPEKIVMYAGGNDIDFGIEPEEVCNDFKAFVEKVQARLPKTEIIYIGITPNPARWVQLSRIKMANDLIAEYVATNPKLKFIDVWPHMLQENGAAKKELYVSDGLHMNPKGYELWTELLRPVLDKK